MSIRFLVSGTAPASPATPLRDSIWLRSIPARFVRQRYPAILSWIAGVIGIAVVYLSFYPSIRSDPALASFGTDGLPEGVAAAIGIDADLTNGPTYLGMSVFNLLLPFLFIAFGVVSGTRAIAGDEERGEMDLLLSLPVERVRFVVARSVAIIGCVATLGLIAWGANVVMGGLVDIGVSADKIAAAVLSTALLGLVVGFVALAIGGLTGRANLAVGGSLGFALVSYVLNAPGLGSPDLSWLRNLSVFHAAAGGDPLVNGFDPAGTLTLATLAAMLMVVAALGLRARDIRA